MNTQKKTKTIMKNGGGGERAAQRGCLCFGSALLVCSALLSLRKREISLNIG
ncbi:hypothetical protein RchiOBHm_Chr7g0238511 [Rosa chinensis]|uniref:Uncharacterized protein n=1 Tax=Rosa chinensis TaxID=74649 RepID=A0A2P6PHG9_ROSCH|nr:hypothetical protein RchiOBHm_Chr7g0238511 [Rosa chinensis]